MERQTGLSATKVLKEPQGVLKLAAAFRTPLKMETERALQDLDDLKSLCTRDQYLTLLDLVTLDLDHDYKRVKYGIKKLRRK